MKALNCIYKELMEESKQSMFHPYDEAIPVFFTKDL